MALTAEQVRHVAALARLALGDDEVERFRAQLSAILDAAAALGEVDTTGVEPTAQAHLHAAPWREDEVVEPMGADGAFVVPKVIEQP